MLRLSKLSDYGTVIMAHMAREPARSVSAAELADAVGLAPTTVSKVLKLLTRAQLLGSRRGVHGGYALARSPEEISLAQVIAAVEGPIGVTECGAAAGLCAQEAACPSRASWLRVNRVVHEALDGVSLAEFARPAPPPATPVNLAAIHPGGGHTCAP